jgi:signal transduction histidine kinase
MKDKTYSRWISDPFWAGVRFVRQNPQIWSTLLIALFIFASFLFVSDRFIRVAQEAQQELSYVRVAALQNAIAAIFENHTLTEAERKTLLVHSKQSHNAFSEMFLVEKRDGVWATTMVVGPPLDRDISRYEWFFELALIEPSTHAYTEMLGGVSGVTGFRSVAGDTPTVLVTHQQFLASDALIQRSIDSSIVVLAVILGIIFFLLFHHARIIDYSTLYKRLKEVNQLKDDFISMASHELRSPLTAVRGYTALINERGGLPAETYGYLEKIDRAAATLNQLIEDILDVSRIDQGRLTLDIQPVRIAEVAEEVCGLFAQKVAEKALTFRSENIDADLVAYADRVRLRQVLINLIDNAIKYTQEGTVELSITREKEFAVIRVTDSGLGMSAEDQQGLFNKFYRVNNAAVRRQTGTGLGLWITKELVERMQGTISVESIQGLGTHMIVRLPLAKQ